MNLPHLQRRSDSRSAQGAATFLSPSPSARSAKLSRWAHGTPPPGQMSVRLRRSRSRRQECRRSLASGRFIPHQKSRSRVRFLRMTAFRSLCTAAPSFPIRHPSPVIPTFTNIRTVLPRNGSPTPRSQAPAWERTRLRSSASATRIALERSGQMPARGSRASKTSA
jgi:hypothetical protein